MNTIPVIHVTGRGMPLAWERSLRTLKVYGSQAPTQYDRPGDPPSLDAMAVVETVEPLLEPRIHSFMPGGPYDLQSYCMEVMEGVKDHWIRKPGEPKERWSYTYHGRIVRDFGVNQLDAMVAKLSKQPFTRQAQFTTWMPATDPEDFDPPCLQRGWCRILRHPKGRLQFHSHVYFRSRDALKAAFMNTFAFVKLFDELVRLPVQRNLGEELDLRPSCGRVRQLPHLRQGPGRLAEVRGENRPILPLRGRRPELEGDDGRGARERNEGGRAGRRE